MWRQSEKPGDASHTSSDNTPLARWHRPQAEILISLVRVRSVLQECRTNLNVIVRYVSLRSFSQPQYILGGGQSHRERPSTGLCLIQRLSDHLSIASNTWRWTCLHTGSETLNAVLTLADLLRRFLVRGRPMYGLPDLVPRDEFAELEGRLAADIVARRGFVFVALICVTTLK